MNNQKKGSSNSVAASATPLTGIKHAIERAEQDGGATGINVSLWEAKYMLRLFEDSVVFVLIGNEGDYDAYHEWVEGVFTSPELAQFSFLESYKDMDGTTWNNIENFNEYRGWPENQVSVAFYYYEKYGRKEMIEFGLFKFKLNKMVDKYE